MIRFSLKSLLATTLLALTAVPLAGQTGAELEEAREREMQARQEADLRSHEEHQEARRALQIALEEARQIREERGREAREELRVALEEAREVREGRAQERATVARLVREHEREARTRALQEREVVLARALERARDQERKVQQVVVRVRARVRLGVSLDGKQGSDYDGQGVLVKSVLEDSPAEKAGLLEGDIITHIGGQSLTQPIADEEEEGFDEEESLPVQRLMALVGEMEGGQEVEVRYLRDGAQATVTLTTDERGAVWSTVAPGAFRAWSLRYGPEKEGSIRLFMPDREKLRLEVLPHLEDLKTRLEDLEIEFDTIDFPTIHLEDFEFDEDQFRRQWVTPRIHLSTPGDLSIWSDEEGGRFRLFRGDEGMAWSFATHPGRFGLELRKLNPDLASYFSADEGVLVLDVEEDSTLGLKPGDVILRIGDRDVEDVGDVNRILASYDEDESVTFTIMRNGAQARVEGTKD